MHVGWDWYWRWLFTVLGVPSLACAVVGLRWLWGRRTDPVAARQAGVTQLFLIVLLLYPQISQQIFAALRCRKLSETLSVLEVDYAVHCDTVEYGHASLLAYLLVLLWPLGIPFVLGWLLWSEWTISRVKWQVHTQSLAVVGRSAVTNRISAEEALLSDNQAEVTLVQFNSNRIRSRYEFCISAYRPECFWFEPLDMLRKLALTGLLQLVERGSAFQVLLGCTLSFMAFGLQQRLQPYAEPEENLLKALVEGQIFLTFLVSFILRVIVRVGSYERFGAEDYGWVIVVSLGSLLLISVGMVAKLSHRKRKFGNRLRSGIAAEFEAAAAGRLAGRLADEDSTNDSQDVYVLNNLPGVLTWHTDRTTIATS